jgi:hypothetical protein
MTFPELFERFEKCKANGVDTSTSTMLPGSIGIKIFVSIKNFKMLPSLPNQKCLEVEWLISQP